MNRPLTIIGFILLGLLLLAELLLGYDTLSRKIALSLTNVFGIVMTAWFARYLKRHGTVMPWVAVWAVAIGIWFDAMGNFLSLYSKILWWDKLAHAVGAAALAVAFVVLFLHLRLHAIVSMSNRMLAFVVIAVVSLFSTLYEISEYLGDQFSDTHRVTDLFDSPDDMMWNLIGTALAVFVTVPLLSRSMSKIQKKPASR